MDSIRAANEEDRRTAGAVLEGAITSLLNNAVAIYLEAGSGDCKAARDAVAGRVAYRLAEEAGCRPVRNGKGLALSLADAADFETTGG